MGLIGREIVQSRIWIDPNIPELPNLNYKESFPITVFEAVRADMNDENSVNLKTVLSNIYVELQNKQPIFPAKSANYVMTFAGVPGAVGAIQMTHNIPWNPNEQSHDKIPTEKAVGDLIQKLGLVDEEGNLVSPEDKKIRWSDIIGRPLMYEELGNNKDGFITQKGVTDAFSKLSNSFDDLSDDLTNKIDTAISNLVAHSNNTDNPHKVTIDQIGAASAELFNEHITNYDNPHMVRKDQVGLGNVDNTADIDKPISKDTQAALDILTKGIDDLVNKTNEMNYIKLIEYDQKSGYLTATYVDDSTIKLLIPIDGLVDEINYDKETKELVIHELSGEIKRVDVSDLFIRYLGSISTNIEIAIKGDNVTGEQTIEATIVPNSITENEMADNSVITRVLADESVTADKLATDSVITIKIGDEAVTTAKLANLAVTNRKVADRAIDGRTLFSSNEANKVLVVQEENSNPVWSLVIEPMLANDSVSTRTIQKGAVTSNELADDSVVTSKIKDINVTTEKLADSAVTLEKIKDSAVDGNKIVESVKLFGTPTIGKSPEPDVATNEIPDTRWVNNRLKTYVFENSNLGDRIVDGRTLFTSPVRHRVLAVLRANTDPVWTAVDHDMMDIDSVGTSNIINLSITREKIADRSIESRAICINNVLNEHLAESVVDSRVLFTSDNANMVLAAVQEHGHPIYTQVMGSMIAHNAITGIHIQDRTITPSKLETSGEPNKVLAVTLSHTNPEWTQVNTEMIKDHAVTLNKIRTSPFQDMVMAVEVAGNDPLWTKVNDRMIAERTIKRENIGYQEVWGEHIQDKAIESHHIMDWTIKQNNIAPGAITGTELFTSPVPNRVLAVNTMPYSKPQWLQVNTDMVEDKAITGDKLFRSEHPHRVLLATQAGKPPEYQRITADFIVDYSITPGKLIPDFTLQGAPTIGKTPETLASDNRIADTKFVQEAIKYALKNFRPEILEIINGEMIEDYSITGTKFFKNPYDGQRVLGTTKNNDDVEYILIEESLIVDGAITENKIRRDINLLGTPSTEIRPADNASDANGDGHKIPDCQWVLDRIKSAGITPGTSGEPSSSTTGVINDGSITTPKLQNRAVTGAKLFTSQTANRLLGVETPNSDPTYLQANTDMIKDRAINGKKLFSSTEDNRVLIVDKNGTDPKWGKVNLNMMEENSVDTAQLVDSSVTNEKIANYSIDKLKFAEEPMIGPVLLEDNSVVTSKIKDAAVETPKIKDKAVTNEKLQDDVCLRGYPTVESNTDYERRSIRNTILSPNAPSGGLPGDIWIRYI